MSKQREVPLVLTISLIPHPTWGRNLNKLLPPNVWKQLREKVYAEAAFRCSICDVGGNLHADEVWAFDEDQAIQKLVSIRAVCADCHNCKHWGRTTTEARITEQKRLIRHFCKVNRTTVKTFEANRKQAYEDWHRRKNISGWQVDFGEWSHLVKDMPPRVLPSRKPKRSDVEVHVLHLIPIPVGKPGREGEEEAWQFFSQFPPDLWLEYVEEWERRCTVIAGHILLDRLLRRHNN